MLKPLAPPCGVHPMGDFVHSELQSSNPLPRGTRLCVTTPPMVPARVGDGRDARMSRFAGPTRWSMREQNPAPSFRWAGYREGCAASGVFCEISIHGVEFEKPVLPDDHLIGTKAHGWVLGPSVFGFLPEAASATPRGSTPGQIQGDTAPGAPNARSRRSKILPGQGSSAAAGCRGTKTPFAATKHPFAGCSKSR